VSTETKTTLYEHIKHLHTPRNVNDTHKAEQEASGVNTRVAVTLTKAVGTMWMAYLFTVLALVGLFGLLGWLNPFVFLLATWVSQQFAQLVLLPIIMVGQNVLSRHSELQAEEAFQTTMKSYHDTEQIIEHLNKQDEKILEILTRLDTQQTRPVRAVKKKTEAQG